jgi:cytochrome b
VPASEPAANSRVHVWDAAVRISHWSLASLVAFDLVRDDGDWLHRAIGYTAVGIVFARLLWGVVARGHGCLATMKPSPRATLVYVQALLRGHAPRCAGHDPLGLWMVWLLWTLVLLLGLTGWMSRLDAFWGDALVQDLHVWLADALLVAVVLHLAGVATMSWLWRENLPAAMVTGRKRDTDRFG